MSPMPQCSSPIIPHKKSVHHPSLPWPPTPPMPHLRPYRHHPLVWLITVQLARANFLLGKHKLCSFCMDRTSLGYRATSTIIEVPRRGADRTGTTCAFHRRKLVQSNWVVMTLARLCMLSCLAYMFLWQFISLNKKTHKVLTEKSARRNATELQNFLYDSLCHALCYLLE